MIAALALTLAPASAAPQWVAIGVSGSELRVFVDRHSLRDTAGLRYATVRIGSPRSIAGPVVLVYQHEAFDCRAKTWRLLSYDARDAGEKVVRRGTPTGAAAMMVPTTRGTIGSAVLEAVCGA